jgi:hypothetical protein
MRQVLMLAVAVGCGGSSTAPPPQEGSARAPIVAAKPAPTPALPEVAPPDAASVPVATTRAYPSYPAAIEPKTSACTLRGGWKPDQPRKLALHRNGAGFATLYHVTSAELSLADGAFVELASDKARLWGYVSQQELTLHAAKPFVVADYVAPGSTARLRWLGKLAFEVQLPKYVTARVPPRGDLACDSVALDVTQDLDSRDAIDAPALSQAQLPDERTIAVAAKPGDRRSPSCDSARATGRSSTSSSAAPSRRGS